MLPSFAARPSEGPCSCSRAARIIAENQRSYVLCERYGPLATVDLLEKFFVGG